MPSPLFPACCQTNVHLAPAAITPGIAVAATSRSPAAGAGPRPPPRLPPGPRPPRAGGGVLHIAVNAAYPGSAGACTDGAGALAGAGGNRGASPNSSAEPATDNATVRRPVDFMRRSSRMAAHILQREFWHLVNWLFGHLAGAGTR